MNTNPKTPHLLYALLLTLVTAQVLPAQPERVFSRIYETDNEYGNYFRDVYCCEDGGYIMSGEYYPAFAGGCGRLVRVNENGDVIWANTISDINFEFCTTVIELDNGDFAVGGLSAPPMTTPSQFVARVDADGDPIWYRLYEPGSITAIIELKSGELLASAGDPDGNDRGPGILMKLNGEGDTLNVWHYYADEDLYLDAMIETEEGIAVAGKERDGPIQVRMINPDNGEIIWLREFAGGIAQPFASIVRASDGGLTVACRSTNRNIQRISLIKLTIEGETVFEHTFDWPGVGENAGDMFRWVGLARMRDGGYTLATYRWDNDANRGWPLTIRTDVNGEEQWRRIYDEGQNFMSVVRDRRDRVIAAGAALGRDAEEFPPYAGWLIQLEPDRPEPTIVEIGPDGNDFDHEGEAGEDGSRHEYLRVLKNSEVNFFVGATDQQDRELTYTWFDADSNVISEDTAVTVLFEETGLFQINCVVSNGPYSVRAIWDVTVKEILVVDFLPPSRELWIRRGTPVDFWLEATGYLEEMEFGFRWNVVEENGAPIPIGDQDSMTYNFPRSGDWRVFGEAYQEEFSDMRSWLVHVRSALLCFYPDLTLMTVPTDTTLYFELFPFNPESDSLSYRFTRNGEAASDSSNVLLIFPEEGEYTIDGFIYDGSDADSVRWIVTVVRPNDVESGRVQPAEFGFQSTRPNPFNSATTIKFGITEPGHIVLEIVDINGRIVEKIIDGDRGSGWQSVVWNAAGFPGGVYFCRLSTMKNVATTKLVLIR